MKKLETTPRLMILLMCESPDLLSEMEQRCLLRDTDKHNNYIPTSGSFALLGDEDELYKFAQMAFERTAYALWNLYRAEGPGVDHEPFEFMMYVNRLYVDPAPDGLIPLGLYLVNEFGLLQPMMMAENRINILKFRINESAIKMRDPAPRWLERVRSAREMSPRFGVPIDQLIAVASEPLEAGEAVSEPFDEYGFWGLIHPAVAAEARPRFEGRQYADAVEAALKIVAQNVRKRSGLTIDGAALMRQAFSPQKPYLLFEDPIPDTQNSMQLGYMDIFAGTMTGIRNPKAHGLVKLEKRRAIHFLFLASLLAEKIDEASDAPWRTTP